MSTIVLHATKSRRSRRSYEGKYSCTRSSSYALVQDLVPALRGVSCLRDMQVMGSAQSLSESSAFTPERIDVSQIVMLNAAAVVKLPTMNSACEPWIGTDRVRWTRYTDAGHPSRTSITMTNST